MSLHTFCFLVPDRAYLQIRFMYPECSLSFGKLDICFSEFFVVPIIYVGSQHITAFAQSSPIAP